MLRADITYSNKELTLLKHFDLDLIAPRINPLQIYQLAAVKAFQRNEENNRFTNSLRNILNNYDLAEPVFRETPKFDALIDDMIFYQGLKPIPHDYRENIMSIDVFLAGCKSSLFTDSDGHGKLATDTEMSSIIVYPSDILLKMAESEPFKWTHVVWFNK